MDQNRRTRRSFSARSNRIRDRNGADILLTHISQANHRRLHSMGKSGEYVQFPSNNNNYHLEKESSTREKIQHFFNECPGSSLVSDTNIPRKNKYIQSNTMKLRELDQKLDQAICHKKFNNDLIVMNNKLKETDITVLDSKYISIFRGVAKLWLRHKKSRNLESNNYSNNQEFHKKSIHLKRSKRISPAVNEILGKYQVNNVPSLQFFGNVQDKHPTKNSQLGVCYSIDPDGKRQRHVRLQRYTYHDKNSQSQRHESSLHEVVDSYRRMKTISNGVALKRQAFLNISRSFNKRQDALKSQLESQLVIREVEAEKYQRDTPSSCYINTELPQYKAHKDLNLVRLRKQRIQFDMRCQTLEQFAALINRIEIIQLITGEKMNSSETHILALFRQLVDHGIGLTKPMYEAMIDQLSEEDLSCSRAQLLLEMIEKFATSESNTSDEENIVSCDFTGHDVIQRLSHNRR